MLYVKRWAPEDWPLAFQGQIHLLSSQDFALIEHEMHRTIDRRNRRPERPPHRPRPVGERVLATVGAPDDAEDRQPEGPHAGVRSGPLSVEANAGPFGTSPGVTAGL
jgi:hypothetical protein